MLQLETQAGAAGWWRSSKLSGTFYIPLCVSRGFAHVFVKRYCLRAVANKPA